MKCKRPMQSHATIREQHFVGSSEEEEEQEQEQE